MCLLAFPGNKIPRSSSRARDVDVALVEDEGRGGVRGEPVPPAGARGGVGLHLKTRSRSHFFPACTRALSHSLVALVRRRKTCFNPFRPASVIVET